MHLDELPEKSQDYLKTIWAAMEQDNEPATHGAIAKRLGQKPSTASEAIKRLVKLELVHHEPYGGVTLTAAGNKLAVTLIRRHRLIETFLVEKLGYGWDEIHDEADRLEHAVTDEFIARIDALLGRPTRDPHGDPIPDADGRLDRISPCDLSHLKPGECATIERIDDTDPELLRYLAGHGVRPGTEITLRDAPYNGMQLLDVDGVEVPLADSSIAAINIVHAGHP
ncbi:metal-dependent transcriptional regulator [Corynebacterium ulceribovis]|uniref:metal-dependent transcriptional regulator n=1 Tax=Corynebacterium ulceribovis TaxID=487732 RepID=UPI00037CE3F6|nr:metal-dependent transcriptional regulator [Corynebacterium ulceribovis]